MSALFTAVGFGSFETIKTALGVSPLPPPAVAEAGGSGKPRAPQGNTRRRGSTISGSGSSSGGENNSGSSSDSNKRSEKRQKAAVSRLSRS